MKTSHIIFDLDGTLVNTIEDIALAMNSALVSHGFSALPLAVYPDMVGWGIQKLAALALEAQSRPQQIPADETDRAALINKLAREALDRYDEIPLRFSRPYPEIPELLHILIDEGFVLAVLTNKPDPVARQVVKGLFPDIPFAVIQGDRIDSPKKPDPDLTRSVMEAIGAAQGHTLFVGDSVVDVETAHNVGCPIVGVSWGFRGPEELVKTGTDHLITTPMELLGIVGLARKGS